MPTYNGWNVITIPGTPPAAASLVVRIVNITSGAVSPFTGQMQIYDWNASYMEMDVTLPPLSDTDAQEWLSFLTNLKGIAGVFQFGAAFMAQYPVSLPSGVYWRLKENTVEWSINDNRFYGIHFTVRQAI